MNQLKVLFPRPGEPRHWSTSFIPLQDQSVPFSRCPCPCCLTSVRGGGFCAWCRKSGHR